MWVNYLVWCWTNQKTIPGNHRYFEYPYLESLDSSYRPFFNFRRHQPSGSEIVSVYDSDYAAIKLGNSKAYGNFFINVMQKKSQTENWNAWEAMTWGAMGFWNWHDGNLEFNLDWCNIFTNPQEFVDQLNLLSGYEVELDQHTELAFQQYYNSCQWMFEKEKLNENIFFTAWKNYILNHRTDLSLDLETRLAFTEEIAKNSVFLP